MKTILESAGIQYSSHRLFLYVGNSIPQQRKDPPQELELSADMGAADFIKAGQEIFFGKGPVRCVMRLASGRALSDLDGAGSRAETRVKAGS